jgi:spore germination cell wall hydrolase CwlJ-like protein
MFNRWPILIAAAVCAAASPAAAMIGVPPTLLAEPFDTEMTYAEEAPAGAEEAEDLGGFTSAVAAINDAELDADMRCLASAVYNEARGESVEGQLAVAQVVLNRAQSSRYAGSICEVVYAPRQFSFTADGRPDLPATRSDAWRRAEAVAIIAATESWQDVTDRALYFHADYVNPVWRHRLEATRQIGRHIFYR